jgi:hypothetical protein
MAKLGNLVKDKITGFAGIVIGRAEYLNGCISVLVQPEGVTSEGQPIESHWFDEQRLTAASEAKAGGPQPRPPAMPAM